MNNTNKDQKTAATSLAQSTGKDSGCNQEERVAFKMKLLPEKADDYKKRHDEIWPELQGLLKDAGITDYSIFLDEETNILFGVLKVSDRQRFKALPQHEVMQRWWKFMADIMETNNDHSPVSIPLKEVFYLP